SALHIFGLTSEIDASVSDNALEIPNLSSQVETNLTQKFRSRIKPVRFGSAFGCRRLEDHQHGDCRVCLARFEPESVVNRLPCGHLFHQSCVERWIEYRNNTCPLCRSHLLPADNLGQQNSVFVSGARPQL
ncbi:probable E3 ubiquitin-protein ligase XERICO, partial [Phalaenopsis equestris]|uniref:probable E3 ubiquitin-protein ligase XERICO n=1 Tax=Phalaenopsis equestris TaxID=78828 RepID=UPI0009E1E329